MGQVNDETFVANGRPFTAPTALSNEGDGCFDSPSNDFSDVLFRSREYDSSWNFAVDVCPSLAVFLKLCRAWIFEYITVRGNDGFELAD